jgi:hypothetical protein
LSSPRWCTASAREGLLLFLFTSTSKTPIAREVVRPRWLAHGRGGLPRAPLGLTGVT